MLVIVKCMRTSKSLLKSTTKVFKKNTSALHYSIRPIKNHLILDMTHVNTINLDIYRIVTSDFRFIFYIYILLVCFFIGRGGVRSKISNQQRQRNFQTAAYSSPRRLASRVHPQNPQIERVLPKMHLKTHLIRSNPGNNRDPSSRFVDSCVRIALVDASVSKSRRAGVVVLFDLRSTLFTVIS